MANPGLAIKTLRNLLGVMGKSTTPGRVGMTPTFKEFGKNPLAAAGILAPSAIAVNSMVTAPIAEGVYNTFTGDDSRDRLARTEDAYSSYTEDLLYKLSQARKKEEIERNMMAVQKSAPHLYNQVMAGRRLPQGSIVLGGAPRQDLMEELANSMGNMSQRSNDPLTQLL